MQEEKKDGPAPENKTPEEKKELGSPIAEDEDFRSLENKEEAPEASAPAPAETVKAGEEKPAEEVSQEGKKPEASPKRKGVPAPLSSYEYSTPALAAVEEERKSFLKRYKANNIIKWFVSVFCLVLIVAAWVGFANITDAEGKTPGWVLPLQITTFIFSIALILGYILIMNFWLKKKMRKYFAVYYGASNALVYAEKDGYANVTADVPGKIAPVEFIENGLFLDITKVGSRDIVRYDFRGVGITSADAAGQIEKNKRLFPVFVGRYFYADCPYQDDEPIVVYVKGDERGIAPTNVTGLKKVYDDPRMFIATNNGKWGKLVNARIRKTLLSFRTSGILIDVSVAIRKGRAYVLLGFDDALMTILLDKPFDPRPIEELRLATLTASTLIVQLNGRDVEDHKTK